MEGNLIKEAPILYAIVLKMRADPSQLFVQKWLERGIFVPLTTDHRHVCASFRMAYRAHTSALYARRDTAPIILISERDEGETRVHLELMLQHSAYWRMVCSHDTQDKQSIIDDRRLIMVDWSAAEIEAYVLWIYRRAVPKTDTTLLLCLLEKSDMIDDNCLRHDVMRQLTKCVTAMEQEDNITLWLLEHAEQLRTMSDTTSRAVLAVLFEALESASKETLRVMVKGVWAHLIARDSSPHNPGIGQDLPTQIPKIPGSG